MITPVAPRAFLAPTPARKAVAEAVEAQAKPHVGGGGAFARDVQGPVLRAMSKVPGLRGLVAAMTRKAEPLPTTDALVNFQSVVPGVLMRGGLLSGEGLARLSREQKPGAILNLASEYPQAMTGEGKTARALGIEAREMLIDPMRPPTDAEAEAFIAQVDAQQKAVDAAKAAGLPAPGALYVHCYAGSDRTGAMVAAYRIARQGWSADRAIAEMVRLGANGALHPDFQTFVRDFAASHGKP